MEDLEATGYKEGAVAELVALRGRHSVATSLQHYVEFKRGRVRTAVREVSGRKAHEAPADVTVSAGSASDRLKELKKLHEEGLVTSEEFESYRKQALETLVGIPPR